MFREVELELKQLIDKILKTCEVKSMSLVDKAWEILQKVGPFQELDEFIQKLKPTFQEYEDLSQDEARKKRAEIKKKMLERIKSDKQTFGEALAEGAEYILDKEPSIDDERKVVELYADKGEEPFLDSESSVPEPEEETKKQALRQQQQESTDDNY